MSGLFYDTQISSIFEIYYPLGTEIKRHAYISQLSRVVLSPELHFGESHWFCPVCLSSLYNITVIIKCIICTCSTKFFCTKGRKVLEYFLPSAFTVDLYRGKSYPFRTLCTKSVDLYS